MLNREESEKILRKTIGLSKTDEAEAFLGGGYLALTRFAQNYIHQNVSERGYILSVRSIFGKRSGKAHTNILTEDAIKKAVADSEEIAKVMPEDPELPPLAEPQKYQTAKAYDEEIAGLSAQKRAELVKEAIALVKSKGGTCAGAFSVSEGIVGREGMLPSSIANSKGLFAHHSSTDIAFSITVNIENATGWTGLSSHWAKDIDVRGLTEIAIEKAMLSKKPKDVSPGSYDVFLEPEAVTGLMQFVTSGFSAQAVDDGESFLVGKVGEKVVGENFTMIDDAYHKLQGGCPFDGEGMPRQKVVLVEKGVAKALVHDLRSAARHNTKSTGHGFPAPNTMGGHPINIVIEGGELSPTALRKQFKSGILVTKFWYSNFVNRRRCIVTGMTRDGTFWVENGKIKYAVKNFRFNQDLIKMLGNIISLSEPVRTTSMVAPAMIIKDFTFTSSTDSQ